MNKKISTQLALVIVFTLAIFFGFTFWIMNKGNNTQQSNVSSVVPDEKITQQPQPEKCQIKAYASKSAKVKLWMDENKSIHIADESLSMLPNYSDTKEFKNENAIVKIIDISSQVEKKLTASSAAKPAEVDITGYAKTCKGFALACLNYKDGIFGDYLD